MTQSKEEPDQRLKKSILQYLHEHGATSYNTLHVYFDPHMNAKAASILDDLRSGHFIELDGEMLKITSAGLNLLLLLS